VGKDHPLKGEGLGEGEPDCVIYCYFGIVLLTTWTRRTKKEKKGFAKLLTKPTLTKKTCFILNKGIRNGLAGLILTKEENHKK
jgi:hypothetical protein